MAGMFHRTKLGQT